MIEQQDQLLTIFLDSLEQAISETDSELNELSLYNHIEKIILNKAYTVKGIYNVIKVDDTEIYFTDIYDIYDYQSQRWYKKLRINYLILADEVIDINEYIII